MKKTISVDTKYNLGDFVLLKRYYPHSDGCLVYGRVVEIKATLGKGVVYTLERDGTEYHEDDLVSKEEYIEMLKEDIWIEIRKREEMLEREAMFLGKDYFKKHIKYLESNFGINLEILQIRDKLEQ